MSIVETERIKFYRCVQNFAILIKISYMQFSWYGINNAYLLGLSTFKIHKSTRKQVETEEEKKLYI